LLAAIIADLEGHAAQFALPQADTVFFGGGTPSLLTGVQIGRLLETVDRVVGLRAGAEVTLEANPEDRARFAEHAAAGVNRFSLGVQALNEADLKALGRFHSAGEAKAAVEAAAATGRRVSLDLIYARQGQTLSAWEAELREALSWPVEHLSLYQLTVEGETAFARAQARGRLVLPPPDLAGAFYQTTLAATAERGFPAYEVSNHARSREGWSAHNLLYWTGGQWLGLGPGAHGRVLSDGGWLATEAQARPEAYGKAVSETGVGWASSALLTGEEAGDERLLMGLRTVLGAPIADVEALWGRAMTRERLAALAAEGYVIVAEGVVRLTPQGFLVADRIALELAG
jgi:oxygen-independent coproporphyrinogen-3 oxidase